MPRKTPSGSAANLAVQTQREVSPRRCVYDGTTLEAEGERDGWCPEAGAYALAYRVWVIDAEGGKRELAREGLCPFACPVCRRALTWDGGCDACHGRQTLREPMTFPGDRWELGADRHYRRVALGPRPVATEAEVHVGLAEIKRALAAIARRAPSVTARELTALEPAWVTSGDTGEDYGGIGDER